MISGIFRLASEHVQRQKNTKYFILVQATTFSRRTQGFSHLSQSKGHLQSELSVCTNEARVKARSCYQQSQSAFSTIVWVQQSYFEPSGLGFGPFTRTLSVPSPFEESFRQPLFLEPVAISSVPGVRSFLILDDMHDMPGAGFG